MSEHVISTLWQFRKVKLETKNYELQTSWSLDREYIYTTAMMIFKVRGFITIYKGAFGQSVRPSVCL